MIFQLMKMAVIPSFGMMMIAIKHFVLYVKHIRKNITNQWTSGSRQVNQQQLLVKMDGSNMLEVAIGRV